MTPDDAARAVRPCFPGPEDPVVTPVGEGDYCRAFGVGGGWIFLFAKTDEASASLERVERLTPLLARALLVSIPVVAHSGRFCERVFVGYRRLDGRPLGPSARSARELASFVRELHRFDASAARAAGVPACEYPFGATEDGVRTGTAEGEYWADLRRLASHGLPPATIHALERALGAHLAAGQGMPAALLHGELSPEHVLVDGDGGLTGVIDLNGMIVGDPARDLLYVYEELGAEFVELVLAAGAIDEPAADVLRRLRFLRLWHAALRALWLLEHGYAERAPVRLAEVNALLQV